VTKAIVGRRRREKQSRESFCIRYFVRELLRVNQNTSGKD
jgi:hypothetical protein